jgi:4-hydroxybenzoate polyprenyltransferase
MYKFKHKNILFFLSELRRFVRVETDMVVVCMALSGYLIFNAPASDMLFLASALFFASGAGYAYNHYTDKEEDIINNRYLNFFATSKKGYYIVLACVIIGIASAAQLSPLSFGIYLISMAAGIAYSAFRVKKFFPMKNVYSGFFMSTSFLIGATAGNQILYGVIPYFLLVFLIGLTGNLLGDVRGHEGDKIAGVNTIPVKLGTKTAKRIIHFNFGLFSLTSIMSGYVLLTPIIPSLAATSFFLNRNDHRRARSSMISTFLVLVVFLAAVKITGI